MADLGSHKSRRITTYCVRVGRPFGRSPGPSSPSALLFALLFAPSQPLIAHARTHARTHGMAGNEIRPSHLQHIRCHVDCARGRDTPRCDAPVTCRARRCRRSTARTQTSRGEQGCSHTTTRSGRVVTSTSLPLRFLCRRDSAKRGRGRGGRHFTGSRGGRAREHERHGAMRHARSRGQVRRGWRGAMRGVAVRASRRAFGTPRPRRSHSRFLGGRPGAPLGSSRASRSDGGQLGCAR